MTIHETVVPRPPRFQTIVGIDAATCLVMAALLVGGRAILAGILGIPQFVLVGAGGILVPVAVFMALVAARSSTPRWAAWTVITGNAAWVIASVVLAFGQFVAPAPLGIAFILGQALVVSIFTAIEYRTYAR
ncbi:hypothetical protein [Mesorhizobium sp. CAU 1741]|uniref:hypothetical protein n=1 Tax=Mesorhizobium sp. CAU 1741 TaxID=3140366 RepID=UPI00325B26A4